MPTLSYIEYTGNGSLTDFTFPFPYLQQSHVTATVNGATAPFSWLTGSAIRFTTAPANNSLVHIGRSSAINARIVNFSQGAGLSEVSLDTSALQNFYMTQEAIDAIAQTNASLAQVLTSLGNLISHWQGGNFG